MALTYADGRPPVTKAKDVTAAVQEIIGLDYSQFSQIAMIAQGQFTKLLNASTEERSRIFRKLFRTQRYARLQDRLQEEASRLNQQRTAQNAKLDSLLSGVQYAPDDPDAAALAALSAQTEPETALALLDALLARQTAAQETAADALKQTETELDGLQQQLGAARQAAQLAAQLTEKQAALAAAVPALEAARTESARHAGDAAQLDALAGRVTQAKAALSAYDALDALCREQKQAADAAQLARAQAAKKRAQLETLAAQLTADEQALAALEAAPTQKLALETQEKELAQRGEALATLQSRLAACQKLAQKARRAQEAYRTAAEAKAQAHARRDALDKAFLDAQAGVLARELTEGAPCPVCGSTHHPAKAHLPRTAPTEVQVNQAKQAAAQADSAAQEASAAAREALTREQEGRAQLRKDAEALLPERFTSPEGPVPLTVSLLRTALAEENDALHTVQADLKQRQTKNHTDCRRKKELEAQRKAQAEQRTALEAQVTAAQQAAAAAQAAVQTLEARQAAEQTAQPQMIATLKAEQNELLARRKALAAQEKDLNARLLPNRRALADHRKLADQRDTLDARWQWVNALASTAGGTLSSKQKIRLEAYIQMNYLDRILRHANTRLMQMTAGQYELERIGAENQRSQSGLDLGVIDHYNGTRRSVKTLSGGESFKASLALALGLSDEVQSSAGGIRLDTLFLDEGFGSLDEESLEQAIRVLSGLTEGDRLVGIISHVGALKDRIDRQVVVRKGRTGGSTVELVV